MRRVVLGLLALLLVVPLIAAGLLQRQASALGKPLVADANTLAAARHTIVGAPRSGSIFDCLGPQADAAPDISRTLAWSDPSILAVASGAAPVSSLNATQLGELEATRPWLEATLACGQLSDVAPTAGIGPFADFRHGRRQSMPRLMEALSSAGALALRSELQNGNADLVLDRCVDGLVLTLAWLRLEGFESMLPVLGPSNRFLSACRDAKPLASADARGRFAARANGLRALTPTYADVIFVERTQLALRLFGAWLPDSLDAELPAEARVGTRSARESKWARGFTATMALRLYWKRFDSGMREIETACALTPVPRDAAIVLAQKHLEAPFLKRYFAADPVDLKYEMYSGYVDNLGAGVTAVTAP
ncbi:MAG: hypothetical protein QM817_39875 [Archangium sp.]